MGRGSSRRDVLYPITEPPRKYKVGGLDLEGDGGSRGFLSAAVCAGNRRFYTTDPSAFVNELSSHYYDGWRLYAHNLTYDVGVILSKVDMPLSVTLLKGRVIRASPRTSHHGRLAFHDSLDLYARLSLEDIGKALGMPKYPTPPQFLDGEAEVPEWYCRAHNRLYCSECYNMNDAEIVSYAVSVFQDWLNEMGAELGMTLAGTAMNLFRARFLDREYLTPFPARNEFARLAYYGGRVEDIVRGYVSGLNIFDVHSLYPSVMHDYEFPDTNYLVGPVSDPDPSLIFEYEGVSHVLVEVPYMYIPPLPMRVGGRLFFPYGTFEGYYTHAELRFAVSRGVKLLRVYETLYSKRTCRPFVSYVSTLYAMRSEYKRAGDPRQLMVKIMLNSLYGKFGQRLESGLRRLYPIEALFEAEDSTGWDFCVIGDQPYSLKPVPFTRQPAYINLLWASYVTSYGRMRLYEYMEKADFHVSYCDTDSIFTPVRMETGDGLGALGSDAVDVPVLIVGPKMYHVMTDGEGRTKAKGVPKRYQAAFLYNGSVTYLKPVGILEGIRRGISPSTWVEMQKVMGYNVPKREPLGDVSDALRSPLPTRPWEASRLLSLCPA